MEKKKGVVVLVINHWLWHIIKEFDRGTCTDIICVIILGKKQKKLQGYGVN